jgi:oligopeptide/dipeptide ABC transporter ATP-binding protein
MSEQKQIALQVEDLHIAIDPHGKNIEAVTGVSFSIAQGEMVGLVGESGSGKTLTGLAVMGLLPRGVARVAGKITVEGRVVGEGKSSDVYAGRREDLGMIFQNPMTSLNPAHRVGDQIAEAVRRHSTGVSKKAAFAEAVELLRLVEIRDPEGVAKKYPHQLSGGMRQRVVIAIAVACKPQVLIADEPTTALDVTVQASVMELIDRLRKELNLGVLFISHDLALVSGRCERVLVMYAGELVEHGAAQSVLTEAHHPYVDGLLRCIPDRALELGVLEPLRGRVPRPGDFSQACRFAPRCDYAISACTTTRPELNDLEPGRAARCIRLEEPGFSLDTSKTVLAEGVRSA